MQGKSTHKATSKESQDDSKGAVDVSQPMLEDEVVLEEEVMVEEGGLVEEEVMVEEGGLVEEEVMVEEAGVLEEEGCGRDEGYQSALDCTTCKNGLVKLEESYKQQIAALELELKNQQNLIDKYYYIKNELANDEENFFEGKGKGGKGYVKKGCDLQQLALKEQYLSKIGNDEKRRFGFLQLDNKAQRMICEIEALRGPESDNDFIDELLETFEEKSMQLQRQKKTVEEMKEQEGEYINTIDDLMEECQKITKEKDLEVEYLRDNVQVVLVEKDKSGGLGDMSKSKKGKKCKEHLKTNDEYQVMVASMEVLRQMDIGVYENVVQMLGRQE